MKLDYTIDKKPSVSPETRINMQMRLNERLASTTPQNPQMQQQQPQAQVQAEGFGRTQ